MGSKGRKQMNQGEKISWRKGPENKPEERWLRFFPFKERKWLLLLPSNIKLTIISF